MSPSSSTLKLNKSNTPSPAGSTLSLASNTGGGPLKLGDRVIVSSQTGTKTGVLRYQGPCDFAAGTYVNCDVPEREFWEHYFIMFQLFPKDFKI